MYYLAQKTENLSNKFGLNTVTVQARNAFSQVNQVVQAGITYAMTTVILIYCVYTPVALQVLNHLRKTVHQHLDTSYQITNKDLGNWQESKNHFCRKIYNIAQASKES